MNTTTDPIAELRELRARQAAQKIQFEADERAAQARVEQIEELKRPVYKLGIQRNELLRRMANIVRLNRGYQQDAALARTQLHDEFQIRGDRGALHFPHLRVVQLEDLIVETDKSLAILRDDSGRTGGGDHAEGQRITGGGHFAGLQGTMYRVVPGDRSNL